ncbi:MAG: hypothetical protein KKD44_27080, partial [Proteobacteria bacterium]|nr:hypothetical protein [Pseudomonadota bacterium]
REFSRLSKRYPALRQMIVTRSAMWANFKREAGRKGWESDRKVGSEWRKRLERFYSEERYKTKRDRETGLSVAVLTNWIVQKDVHGRKVSPRPSPWDWYDSVFNRLPDELKWDTPRTHRAKGGQGEVNIDKVQTRRWIEDLKKTIARTDDPEARARFMEQIGNLEESLRRVG